MQPIRVLQIICSTGFYGAERWTLALARHFDKSAVVCDLVVPLEADNQTLELVEQYKKLGLKVHRVPMAHKFDYRVIAKLSALIKKESYQIIHTHGYKSDILGVLAARKAGILSLVTPHGFENSSDLKLRLFIWLGAQAMRRADLVVPLSKALCRDVLNMGVKQDKLVYVQNGVDLSEVEAVRVAAEQEHKSEIKRIGFIGQMISRKNILDILNIFDQLQQTQPNIELVLLGDGEDRVALEAYANTLDSAAKISFLGFRNDRLALLKSFDLFVMTSTLEGIPRCLMEAMAMGIPVAAYQIAGIDQLIEHNQSGLLAPLGDKELLLTYWQKLLNDPKFANELAESAREFVHQHYSAQRMADEYLAVYKNMLKDDSPDEQNKT
ncbi:glycosyltransferase [Gayadomonas joobiniege]|uniref:glycosyltransferase n=1 Tax=Gayadomonas joobiniege TaxID=1234606 RepID=UPI000381B1BC